jgi:hypothetical protein
MGNDLPSNQPIKEHADGGQVLLDRWSRCFVLLDICSHNDRIEAIERPDPASVAPIEELLNGLPIREPRVLVPYRYGEKLKEAANAPVPGMHDWRRQRIEAKLDELSGVVSDKFFCQMLRLLSGPNRSMNRSPAGPPDAS